jgi:uncharacterized repeat protein (TIGR03803 family)
MRLDTGYCIAFVALLVAGRSSAQTFTPLHNFGAASGSPATNAAGAEPFAGLTLAGNTLYGTAAYGGPAGQGTIFKLNTDGTGFTNLHIFAATSGLLATNTDGASPDSELVVYGDTIYGTAPSGGSAGNGTLFALTTNGTGFTVLHSFPATSGPSGTNSDRAFPWGPLTLVGNMLYGAAQAGGSSGSGVIFAISTNGTGFTNLHSFNASSDQTNSGGASPNWV